jgi:hypothetical protein
VASRKSGNLQTPDMARVRPPDMARVRPPDMARVSPPDTARVRPPDTARIRPPDTARIRPPDVARISTPMLARHSPPMIARHSLPMPPRHSPPMLAHHSPPMPARPNPPCPPCLRGTFFSTEEGGLPQRAQRARRGIWSASRKPGNLQTPGKPPYSSSAPPRLRVRSFLTPSGTSAIPHTMEEVRRKSKTPSRAGSCTPRCG